MIPNEKEIRWLLKDKYNFSDSKINHFLQSKSGWSHLGPTQIKKDIERIKAGEPVNYVIGWVDFLGCKIDLSKKTLIPRPETEFWVSKVINELQQIKTKNFDILDLCCGSGCIGISVLKQVYHSNVSFADISPGALEQSQINLDRNFIKKNKYKIIKTNLFKNISSKYDFILCNPPYVSVNEKNLDLQWEPKKALYAKHGGLFLIEKIIIESPGYLNGPGLLFLEFGYNQKKEIKEILKTSLFKKYKFYKDQFGKYRYLKAII
ncbi:protein-(glutamine-N5) methyltransferase, release factor-specific [candidate division WWE3 bacterium CG10_big_fil_rev_8_21_14_0_10_32_10]|uniref:peptide chain release factor N(5)-glutamine methyltransferase n=1 Tax=candidate division WWE3 bacterium CG10_big_fil_rev_8_21_14_0_10_32_10 TaxID=1975090 RepID=A0A2H0R9D7_UNCKA|nr:MAG: protein-(glutamine-N5) methyltransferase, release factor-specific [candidate division WWE3 bacterium CG10_big_fil_rev_8_21_14_0_10_32_10]